MCQALASGSLSEDARQLSAVLLRGLLVRRLSELHFSRLPPAALEAVKEGVLAVLGQHHEGGGRYCPALAELAGELALWVVEGDDCFDDDDGYEEEDEDDEEGGYQQQHQPLGRGGGGPGAWPGFFHLLLRMADSPSPHQRATALHLLSMLGQQIAPPLLQQQQQADAQQQQAEGAAAAVLLSLLRAGLQEAGLEGMLRVRAMQAVARMGQSLRETELWERALRPLSPDLLAALMDLAARCSGQDQQPLQLQALVKGLVAVVDLASNEVRREGGEGPRRMHAWG